MIFVKGVYDRTFTTSQPHHKYCSTGALEETLYCPDACDYLLRIDMVKNRLLVKSRPHLRFMLVLGYLLDGIELSFTKVHVNRVHRAIQNNIRLYYIFGLF